MATIYKNVSDVIGLSLTATGYAVGFAGETARNLGADGLKGSWTKGESMGRTHADTLKRWTMETLGSEAGEKEVELSL